MAINLYGDARDTGQSSDVPMPAIATSQAL